MACFVVAVIYAFALGENLPVLFCITDGLIYGSILCLTGFSLWNIFRFAMPANYTPKYRITFIFILAILTGILISGIETFAIYLCFPSLFDSFLYSIPARLFVTLLIFVIIRLLYISHYEKNKNPEEKTQLKETRTKTSNLTTPSIDRIAVRSGQKIKIIAINEIIYIKADGDYISIHTPEGSWLKEQTMKYTEDTLPINCFVRVHRSYIVNINHISRIERYGEKQQIILHNNEKIKISTARYQTLKQILGF